VGGVRQILSLCVRFAFMVFLFLTPNPNNLAHKKKL
jgi:hypothetical protein